MSEHMLKMTYAKRFREVQGDPTISYWVKDALVALDRRNPLHAERDIAVLHELTQMRIEECLIDEYRAWNKAEGLNLGSADEHLCDDCLTVQQRGWVRDFSRRWESLVLLRSKK
jgi:hypothetical protein